MNVDVNKLIEKLTAKLAQKEAQIAVLEAQIELYATAQSQSNLEGDEETAEEV
jgi:hypothetical protein